MFPFANGLCWKRVARLLLPPLIGSQQATDAGKMRKDLGQNLLLCLWMMPGEKRQNPDARMLVAFIRDSLAIIPEIRGIVLRIDKVIQEDCHCSGIY